MRKIFILLLLVLFSLTLFSATIEVSKPFKITNDDDYDRGNDITYGDGYYWLAYGKSTTCTGTNDQTYGNGNPDHNNYHPYYKKATSIEGLATATEVPLMYDGEAAVNMSSYGESWIEFFDNKIFIVLSEYDVSNGKNIKLFWTDDEGATWNKVDNIVNATAQHCDIEVFNNELYLAWSTSICHVSDPTSISAWTDAVAAKYTLPSSSGTARFFADQTDTNPANHVLYLACLNNSWNGGLVYTYDQDLDTWDAGQTIEYAAYDPVLTKYEGNFIYLQAPWITPHQSYLYAYTTDVDEFVEENFRLFDESAYNVGTPVGDNDSDWVCMWGQAMVDLYGASPTENTVVVYCSERNDSDPLAPRNADLYAMEMNWGLGNNHYTYINSAIYGAICDMVEITVPFNPAIAGDVINVISGTYVEDVVIPVDLSIQGNCISEIDGNVTVDSDDATVQGFEITGTLDFDGSGTVYANYNYWGSASGPEGGDITGGGDVRYIPYYTDAAMSTLGPVLSVAIVRNATQTTLTWSDDGIHEYTVYGCNDPDADFPGRAWTEIAGVVSGTPFTSSYQFYAVVTEDWNDGATITGFYEYAMEPGYNYVPIALDYGYTNVTDMPTDLGISSGHTISIWDAVTQGWVSATYQGGTTWDPSGGIDIGVGDVVVVGAGLDDLSTIYLEAQIPDNWTSFDLNITATTDMNLIYLPLDMADCTTLGDVAASIGSQNANTISIWDESNQAWITATYIEFYDAWTYSTQPIQVGQAMMVGAVQNFTWPVR